MRPTGVLQHSPVAPVSPVTPVAPVSPVTPVAPVGPVTPVAPVTVTYQLCIGMGGNMPHKCCYIVKLTGLSNGLTVTFVKLVSRPLDFKLQAQLMVNKVQFCSTLNHRNFLFGWRPHIWDSARAALDELPQEVCSPVGPVTPVAPWFGLDPTAACTQI